MKIQEVLELRLEVEMTDSFPKKRGIWWRWVGTSPRRDCRGKQITALERVSREERQQKPSLNIRIPSWHKWGTWEAGGVSSSFLLGNEM